MTKLICILRKGVKEISAVKSPQLKVQILLERHKFLRFYRLQAVSNIQGKFRLLKHIVDSIAQNHSIQFCEASLFL